MIVVGESGEAVIVEVPRTLHARGELAGRSFPLDGSD